MKLSTGCVIANEASQAHDDMYNSLVINLYFVFFNAKMLKDMDKSLIIRTSIISFIVGAVLGILAPIPFVGTIMLVAMLLLAAPIVMVYMIMDGSFDFTTILNSIITGALAGFCANLTFSSIFALITWIMAVGFKITTNMFLSAMIINSPAWILITFIIFIGVLCATTNAFSGLATHYVIEFIRDMYEKKHKDL